MGRAEGDYLIGLQGDEFAEQHESPSALEEVHHFEAIRECVSIYREVFFSESMVGIWNDVVGSRDLNKVLRTGLFPSVSPEYNKSVCSFALAFVVSLDINIDVFGILNLF